MTHNLKLKLKTLSGFEYKPKPTIKSGSKLVVKDDNGNTLHEGEFKSFTANFMKLLYGNMIGSGSVTATDLNGDSSAIDSYPNVKMIMDGGSTIQKFGIGVGSGSSAVANANNDLTWVSGLTYGAVVVGTPSIDGATIKLDITREISNSSGSAKTLAEAGLIVGAEGGSDENVLIARDLVSVELLTGQKSTWAYSITVDFNSTTGGFVKNFLDSFIVGWGEILADDTTPPSTQFSQRSANELLVFDSKMWVIGGYDGTAKLNDVWNSSDGVTWVEILADDATPPSTQFAQRNQFTSLVFNSNMWVIGGNGTSALNDVWYSSDGVTWIEATSSAAFSARSLLDSIVFNDGSGDKMWVIGGNDSADKNDVWNSSDGVTWVEILADDATPPSTQFSQRKGFASFVFDSKMWVIGGYGSGANINDVWYSSDGVTWIEATSSATFSARRYFASAVFDSKMWVIGGYDSANINDVWYSSDGVTWIEATSSAAFSARSQFASLVFDSKMWVIGGNGATRFNDVWSYGRQLSSESTGDTLGIIVGTSDAAFSSTATVLTAKIDDGTGVGELEYGTFPDATYSEEPAIDGSKTSMSLARTFINNSGASITIKEVGIESVNGLLCRIVLDSAITIANGGSETILIQFETEV